METLEEEQLRFHHVTFPLEVKAKILEDLAKNERAYQPTFLKDWVVLPYPNPWTQSV